MGQSVVFHEKNKIWYKIMFGFIKMCIGLLRVCTIGYFGESLASDFKGPLKYVSLNNQLCQARPALVAINSSQRLYY